MHIILFVLRPRDQSHSNDPEREGLLADTEAARHHESEARKIAIQTLKDSEGTGDFIAKAITHLTGSDSPYKFVLAPVFIAIVVVLWGSMIAGVILGPAGIVAAQIQSGSAALWSSDHCGIWQFDDRAGEEASSRADVYDRKKETRAGEYARNCYASGSETTPGYCNFFYQPKISFSTNSSFECPFPDDKVCVLGSQAVTFDTGLVDASQIGVNAEDKDTYQFRRSTTCTPLNNEYPFVRNETVHNATAFFYHYGKIDDGEFSTDYTHFTIGNPFDWRAPTYHVR